MRKNILAFSLTLFVLHSFSQQMVLDTTFDADGILIGNLRPRPGEDINAQALLVLKDGNMLVAAFGDAIRDEAARKSGVVLARYTSKGVLDKTFGDGGKKQHPFVIRKLLEQPSGKIIGLGYTCLARFNADGTLDNTFGTNGTVEIKLGCNVTLRPDGKIFVISNADRKLVLHCFTENGLPDSGFGKNGIVEASLPAKHYSLRMAECAVLPNNTVVVYASVWKSESSGSVRSTPFTYFIQCPVNGVLSVNEMILPPLQMITHMLVQNNNKILVTGVGKNLLDEKVMTIARFTQTGTIDTSFGNKGIILSQAKCGWDGVSKMTLQPDGKILVATGSLVFSDNDVSLLRYTADGKTDESFGPGGMVRSDIPETPNSFTLLPDGKILILGKFNEKPQTSNGSDYDNFVMVRFTAVMPVKKLPKPDPKKPR